MTRQALHRVRDLDRVVKQAAKKVGRVFNAHETGSRFKSISNSAAILAVVRAGNIAVDVTCDQLRPAKAESIVGCLAYNLVAHGFQRLYGLQGHAVFNSDFPPRYKPPTRGVACCLW